MQLLSELEQFGGVFDCQRFRDIMIYSLSVFSFALPQAMAVLAETMWRPGLKEQEVCGCGCGFGCGCGLGVAVCVCVWGGGGGGGGLCVWMCGVDVRCMLCWCVGNVCEYSLIPRPTPLSVVRFALTDAEERRKRGRPGIIHHMHDVRRMWGGGGGGGGNHK